MSRIELPDWEPDAVEYALPAADPADERDRPGGSPVAPAGHDPVVSLPRTSFDCVNLDALKEHPAVDALLRAQLDQGACFRLLRFPCSLRAAPGSRVEEFRFTVQLGQAHTAPRVHSIFPTKVTVEQERKTEVTLEPSLKLGPVLEAKGGKIGRTITIGRPRATAVGFWSETGADWILRAPERDPIGIEGTAEFLVIVCWDHGVAPLEVTLSCSATVRTPFLRWGTRRVERAYEPFALTGCRPVV
ncbi:hypothetical protein [Amycolatopsis ultiminotia]|uniref:hypothetical protein n=1 Tax=Amycolatopsis ultiminotia TaxID=543629 RepID=UPI0031F005AB